jgi:putative NADH-flavin reductase
VTVPSDLDPPDLVPPDLDPPDLDPPDLDPPSTGAPVSHLTVFGGTGYAGGAIVREAVSRGHQVTAVSRREPDEPVAGVRHVTGSAADEAVVADAIAGADVVVVALAPTGDLETVLPQVVARIADQARAVGARLGVVGGAGSLLASPGGPKVYETPMLPAAFAPHSRIADTVLASLRDGDPDLDWFVLTPALGFGSYAPGTRRGTYRLGGDVLLTDAEGRSEISGADYAAAFVDEIEHPAHVRARFTLAY